MFFSFSIVANSIIQSEGHANIAMISMIIGPVINIPLDYILVTRLQYGIKGAAIATDISQMICFIFLLVYICFNSKILGVKVKNLTINIKLLKGSDFLRIIYVYDSTGLWNSSHSIK